MKILMTGGGTGGHIYPAIAIADALREKYENAEILFVGTKKGLESKIVPQAGYTLKTIRVRGFKRKLSLDTAKSAGTLFVGLIEAYKVIKKFKPELVIGTGGYVCGPVVFIAHLLGIKTAIHEQNAFPGATNKILSRYVDQVFISYEASEKYFKNKEKLILSGNPLRKNFTLLQPDESRKQLKLNQNEFVVLSFGGSRGAEKMNETIEKTLTGLMDLKHFNFIFVTGKVHYKEISERLNTDSGHSEALIVKDYIHDMALYMSAADLVITRGGAIALAEITAMGKPAIIIPSPHVTNNHQYYNGKILADAQAAFMIEEKDFDHEILSKYIMASYNNRNLLDEMSNHSKELSMPESLKIILDHIV